MTFDPSFADGRRRSRHRKQAQLCREVFRLVQLTLDGELRDPRLDDVFVVNVLPEPGGGALLVYVSRDALDESVPDDLDHMHAALEQAAPVMRAQLAAGLHRRRVPRLRFVVLPSQHHG